MQCDVKCYVSGKVFSVKCLARDYDEAKQVALAQHPNARIMGVTAVFQQFKQ
jgi:hypothetical protein|tara:strand:- start:246 stop:401 length:156 start_codon:yes stop_codon:yes gene_type:complete